MKNILFTFAPALLLLFGAPSILFSQNTVSSKHISLFQYLKQQPSEVVDITIESNFRELIRNKYKEEYQPALLTIKGDDGQEHTIEAKIRTRGNSRKKICYYPPFKLKIPKKNLFPTGLDSAFNKYKMVVRCKPSDAYDDYLIREYMAYKVMGAVYPYAFGVQLLNIHYKDVRDNGKVKERTQMAFMIESEEELAQRLNGINIERERSGFHHLEREMCLKMCVFQYMIGNEDWAVPNLHNMKLLKVPEHEKMVPVPYDFDYSGLVDTDYAVVRENLNADDVKDRFYLGPVMQKGEVKLILQYFKSRKSEVFKTIEELKAIDKRIAESIEGYIKFFYMEVENENTLAKVLTQY